MNYQEAIEYLYSKAPMFTHVGKSAYKANLDNSIKLDQYFKQPHTHYKTIHIAGTNGKGSVSHSLAAILHEAGYKIGLYTSPHLKDFRERIKINGIQISEDEVIDFIQKHKNIIESVQPSFFEITTFLAFEYFKQQHVDIAIIETGLGGRLDTTNLIQPILSIITNIGWDHADLLGNSLESIANEKAGIIKKNAPLIIGEHQVEIDEIFIDKADQVDSPFYFADDEYAVKNAFITQNYLLQVEVYKKGFPYLPGLKFQLIGKYQIQNIPIILKATDILKEQGFTISDQNIFRAFKSVVDLTGLHGRWHILKSKPLTICDIGHNYPGLKWNIEQLKEAKKNKLFFVLGFVKDKDISKILGLFPVDAYYIFTKANIPRALDEHELHSIASTFGLKGEVVENVKEAYHKALSLASEQDVVYIGGSTFVVAEVV
ncbi:MAG TPA: folylpolyglutamate synthase/dihydrofolate synthase family protein [Bacteroidales bacterium]|jgi:dihydrofolate synthase/folylpolyglutamate synthase|nr:folylpolyglutamate synthase/dihydrofolate synthase family protein [Bacteroidales bacterium]